MIRLATITDLEEINNIYNQAIDSRQATADLEYITLPEREIWFIEHSPDKYPVFVYELSGNVVGWLSVSPYRKGRKALDQVAEVSYYIDKNFHRQGIGKSLLKYCISHLKEYDIEHIVCILLEINIASIGLLEKFGFTRWGELPKIVNLDGRICNHLYYGLSVDDGQEE
jgi:L-amino acid N-acyltransferase